MSDRPYIVILIEPTREPFYFRYRSENRAVVTIPGATKDSAITVEVGGFTGKAILFVYTVTYDEPYR